MICQTCEQDPCTCPMASSSKGPTRTWLLHTCSAAGCTVMIRVVPGEHDPIPLCTWHNGGTAYNSRQIQPRRGTGPFVTREECGQDLCDAIRLQSRIKTAFHHAETLRVKEKFAQAERIEREMVGVQQQLETILAKNTLAPDDLRRLLAMQ